MAEIAVIEKAPGNFRLDHPDFGVVCRVTFAKGIITEFKKLQDDPIKVEAAAKVQIGEVVSDFLPFFYRAKEDYWNTTDHQAQDLDLANLAYPNAWMSFRGDDEVKVMLVDGKPIAIMGFLDGVPRVGEDIVKLETQTPAWFQMSKQEKYAGGDNGPDGLDLGLKLETELIKEVDLYSGDWEYYSTLRHTISTSLWTSEEPYIHDARPISYDEGFYTYFHCATNTVSQVIETRSVFRYQFHLAKVGAILFLFYSRWVQTDHREATYGPYFDEGAAFRSCITGTGWVYPGGPPGSYHSDCPVITPIAEAECAAGNVDDVYPPPDFSDSNSQVHIRVFAAPYTKELYGAIKANPPTVEELYGPLIPDPPGGFVEQEDFSQKIYEEYWDLRVNWDKGMNYKVRPHTKDELEKAGLWPT